MKIPYGKLHTSKYPLLSAIFGIITTISTYAGYGISNNIEQLPILLRSLENTYLLNDFFTNASARSIARLHYARIVTTLAGSEQNFPLVFLLVTLLANISISVITYHFARHLFKNSQKAGIYASALAMSVLMFSLGWSSTIYQGLMIPSTMILPLLLGAIFALMCGQLLTAMFLSGAASIIHPLLGLETGGILLITFVIFQLSSKRKSFQGWWKAIIPGLLTLAAFSLVSVVPHLSQPKIDSNLFIYIIAYFRHPHHYLPSTFGSVEYLSAAVFLATIILFYYRERHKQEQSSSLMIAILGSLVLLLSIGGYIFVEIIPSRLWVTAQTFRLLYIVRWLGLILIAGTIADKRLDNPTRALYLLSALHPLFLGGAAFSQSLRDSLARNHRRLSRIFAPPLILLIIVALFRYVYILPSSIVLLGLYVLLILAVITFSRQLFYSILLLSTVFVLLPGSLYKRLPYLSQTALFKSMETRLTLKLEPPHTPAGDVAEFARRNTPKESIFLTPPRYGQFRILARRAIVVDFKSFPFTDTAMLEWYNRIINCYGKPTRAGFAMLYELNENYSNITDTTLLRLQKKYNFSYAILYKHTLTHFEILFQNERYKVVSVIESPPPYR